MQQQSGPLDSHVSSYIRDEIAKSIVARDEGVYSTEPGHWPPGARNRRQARDRIRGVPGHECLGRGKATVWSVSVEAYRAHYVRVQP